MALGRPPAPVLSTTSRWTVSDVAVTTPDDQLGPPPTGTGQMRRQLHALRRQLGDPLAFNGYSLIANSAVTGALGLVYWLLMARRYPTAAVGRASALYAAMNLLAGITAQNFNGALNRFLPQAGLRTRTFIVRSYAVSTAASVCMSILFLATIGWWGASYSVLDSPAARIAFVVSVGVWAIFTLQDSVLVGLRSAFWVLVENGIFGLVKIALLVLLVTAFAHHIGIYVSWMLPALVALPLVNWLIFRRIVPRHTLLTRETQPASGRQIRRFLAGDYSGAMFMLATGSLIPVVVAARIDVQQTAYFYVAWVIVGIVDMIGISMGMSLTVEGAFDASALAVNCRRALRKMAVILLPSAALLALFAPFWLGLFGPAYAAHAAPVLVLLAVATVFRAPTELYLGALRAQSRASLVALIQGSRAALMLGLTIVLTDAMGTLGAGVAVATSQALITLMISAGLWRVLHADRDPERVATSQAGGVVADTGVARRDSVPTGTEPLTELAPLEADGQVTKEGRRLPSWVAPAALLIVAGGGFALFFLSVRDIDLTRMNGLGLLSILPIGAIAGVVLIALAFMAGLLLPRAYPVLAGMLTALVICLNGITAAVEPLPRFPTTYQIAGFVQYVSSTGHTAPGLAAYFSWPGFFALISFVTGSTGAHSIMTLLRVWPIAINLLCLVPLFLLMRNLRITWRAQWLAAFFFTVGNWVGQDYFSPQSFNYLLYLVFVAILVNWFVGPNPAWPPRSLQIERLTQMRGPVLRTMEPGEMATRPATAAQRAFLLTLLVAVFTVSTVSHQLTPLFLLGACAGLVVVRRCTLTGLPVLLGVIFAGYFTFAAVSYWSGHLSNVFGALGRLGLNVTNGVSGRLVGSTPTHTNALHGKLALAAVVVGLAVLGVSRRRAFGIGDRVLLVLLVVPVVLIGVASYGGEIILRTYLFMLPAAAVLAALLFFPDWPRGRPSWRTFAVLAACAVVLPVAFFLARYGNEAFEQVPPGELAASNWVYAHDAHGARLLWLSTDPVNDVTPQMPWAYRDLTKVEYIPALAPRNPENVHGILRSLFFAGPGAHLIVDRTQIAAIQQTASYAPDWGARFRSSLRIPDVRVDFATDSAVVYSLTWPPGIPKRPLAVSTAAAAPPHRYTWTQLGLIVFWLLLAALLAREFIRLRRPSATVVRVLGFASVPLFLLLVGDIALRLAVLS